LGHTWGMLQRTAADNPGQLRTPRPVGSPARTPLTSTRPGTIPSMACKGSGVQIPSAPPQVRGPLRPRPPANPGARAADTQQPPVRGQSARPAQRSPGPSSPGSSPGRPGPSGCRRRPGRGGHPHGPSAHRSPGGRTASGRSSTAMPTTPRPVRSLLPRRGRSRRSSSGAGPCWVCGCKDFHLGLGRTAEGRSSAAAGDYLAPGQFLVPTARGVCNDLAGLLPCPRSRAARGPGAQRRHGDLGRPGGLGNDVVL
jgi:hypothetical protein